MLELDRELAMSKVGRERNSLAHELATEARINGDLRLTANVPDRLKKLMLSECNPPLE